MIRAGQILALAVFLGTAAQAGAPEVSIRPHHRPDVAAAIAAAVQGAIRPIPRPDPAVVAAALAAATAAQPTPQPVPATPPRQDPISALLQSLSAPHAASAAAAPAPPIAGVSALAVARSLRPVPRPRNIARIIAAAAAPPAPSRGGSVCGVAEIKGVAIAPIRAPGACGIDAPVRVSSVAGIPLSRQPTIDCTTATALNSWVLSGVIPAVGSTGGGIARLNVIAHYSCRTRNNKPGAKISEHAKGHALDISGVTLRNGTTLTVLDHWRSAKYGKIIKAMHKSACGPFGTVLGPNADRYHQNHLHVDTARYRGGPYCR